tara:strand:- start:922 stop:1908 length:987 start_codon:yes stop_codon:yes gene_type:complete
MNKFFKIALVGGGQLGSRYLQGIVALNLNLDIFVVDPSQVSHDICKSRIREVKNNFDFEKYYQLSSIDGLPKKIDLVIISTQADIRFFLLKSLLSAGHDINFMILEKVLFQNIDEYDHSLKLINDNNIKCWVNCTRRTLPIYKKIKSQYGKHLVDSVTKIELNGGEWGLMSNSIHFLDIISFITGSKKIVITILDKLLPPSESISKRKGIYESSGELQGSCGNTSLKFLSAKDSNESHILKIVTDFINIEIDEVNKKVIYTKNNISYEEDFILPNLSEIAGTIIERILLEGACDLTDIETSVALHKPFINKVNTYFCDNFDESICPLT